MNGRFKNAHAMHDLVSVRIPETPHTMYRLKELGMSRGWRSYWPYGSMTYGAVNVLLAWLKSLEFMPAGSYERAMDDIAVSEWRTHNFRVFEWKVQDVIAFHELTKIPVFEMVYDADSAFKPLGSRKLDWALRDHDDDT